MTPLPGALQSTGLILATVLAAAGLNLGVMSLGQAEGDGADVDTAATPTSADAGLQALNDTAPAALDPSTITMVLPADPAATETSAMAGSTLPAGTGVTPGLPVSSQTSSTPAAASSTAAPATAAANTGPAGTATSQPTTVTTRPNSSQATNTLPPATVTTARPTTVTVAPITTARPTTTTTRAPQTSTYDHTVTGAGSLTVSVTDGARLGLVSVRDAGGWSHTVDTNRADLVKVVFTRAGSEIAVSVTLRNGAPNFTEERSNDD